MHLTSRSWKILATAASSGALAAASLGGVALAQDTSPALAISVKVPLDDADKSLVTSGDDGREELQDGPASPATPPGPATVAGAVDAVDAADSPATVASALSPASAPGAAGADSAVSAPSAVSSASPVSPVSPVSADTPPSPLVAAEPWHAGQARCFRSRPRLAGLPGLAHDPLIP